MSTVPVSIPGSKPADAAPPRAPAPEVLAERRERFARAMKIISASATNRDARAILAAAKALLAQVEQYEEGGAKDAARRELVAAGLIAPDGTACGALEGIVADVSALAWDVCGFQWALHAFISMVETSSYATPEENAAEKEELLRRAAQ